MTATHFALIDADDFSCLSDPAVRDIDTRDIVIMPYLALGLAGAKDLAVAAGQNAATERPVIFDAYGLGHYVIGGANLLNPSLGREKAGIVQCDIYVPEQLFVDPGDSIDSAPRIRGGFMVEEDELWSYVQAVDRNDWDVAETFRQTLRTVQTMRKARDLLKAASATAPESWEDALLPIAQEYPEAWDEDFARQSERRPLLGPEDSILKSARQVLVGTFDASDCDMQEAAGGDRPWFLTPSPAP